MILEDHAKNVIYNQSIQISALTVALDAAQKELQALRPTLASAQKELQELRAEIIPPDDTEAD